MGPDDRPVAIVTGAGRREGIAAAIVARLARDGFDVAFSSWRPYDERMPWGADADATDALVGAVQAAGGRAVPVEIDFEEDRAAAHLFDVVEDALVPAQVLVVAHCESVDTTILDATVESFDRHVAVNARAAWLLVREFARRFRSAPGSGRIVALTSDHTVGNLAYGASKGAPDRIVLAAARELAHLGLTANSSTRARPTQVRSPGSCGTTSSPPTRPGGSGCRVMPPTWSRSSARPRGAG